MPASSKNRITQEEMFKLLAEKLRETAHSPNALAYVPHDKQKRFHSSTVKNKLYIGGNRSGKSVGGVMEGIWRLQGQHPFRSVPEPPIRGRVVCTDFLNGFQKIILPLYAQWTPLSYLRGGSWSDAYSASGRSLHFANGSMVEFMSADQDLDKFAGTSRHFIHLDEEPPKAIFTECKARLVDTDGDWFITMTPVEGMTWIYDDLYYPGIHGLDPNLDIIEVDMTENPYLTEGAIQLFLSGLNKDEIKARKSGIFIQMGGLVYKKFNQDVHVVPSQVPPTDWEWYASVDHGYNNPTAWLWHAVSPDGDVITFGEHYMAEKTVDFHAATVHERNAIYGRVPDIYVGDPALAQRNGVTGTSIFTEYAVNGIPIAPATNDVMTGVTKVQQYLEYADLEGKAPDGKPRWTVTEDCPNLIKEMERLRWKTWSNKKSADQNNKYDIIHKKDDHACDSLRYFFTLMPDPRPREATLRSNRGVMFPQSVSHQAVNYDWQLREEPRSTEWSVSQIDETLGGIW